MFAEDEERNFLGRDEKRYFAYGKKKEKNSHRLLSSTYPSYKKFWQIDSPGKPNSYNDVFKIL